MYMNNLTTNEAYEVKVRGATRYFSSSNFIGSSTKLSNILLVIRCLMYKEMSYNQSYLSDARSLVGEKKLHLGQWSDTKAVFLQPGSKKSAIRNNCA